MEEMFHLVLSNLNQTNYMKHAPVRIGAHRRRFKNGRCGSIGGENFQYADSVGRFLATPEHSVKL